MAYDPTIASAALFEDPSNWDGIIPNVPIFKPHKIKDKKGNDLEVDPERLQKICDKINDNWKRGVAIRFQRGHTKNPTETDQSDQPAIYAYGVGARVGRYGPAQELAILTDMYIRPGYKKYAAELPYRSAEFYPDSNEITAVALLRTDPKLDMGMLLYQSDGVAISQDRTGRVFYYMENVMDFDPTKKPEDDLDKDLGSFGDDDNSTLGKPMGDDDHDGLENDIDPDFEKKMDSYMSKKYQHFPKMYEDMCKKYMSMPSATNGNLPGGDLDKDMPAKPDMPEDDEQYARKGNPEHYQKQFVQMQRELAQVQKELKDERTRRVMQYSKAAIDKLANEEGYLIKDKAKEVQKLCSLPNDEARKERIAEIRENYARDVASGDLIIPSREGEHYSSDDLRMEDTHDFVVFYERRGVTPEELHDDQKYRTLVKEFNAQKRK